MRTDAKRNYDQLLDVAGTVIIEQGVDASLRDIARRAGVGLATLLRHFPTREALLEALLRVNFEEMTVRADQLEDSTSPADAVVLWLEEFIAHAHKYRGVVAHMVAALEDPQSALHASCVTMRSAGTRLLSRAQAEGTARNDIDGTDLFALAGSLAWLSDQPAVEPRVDHLFGIVASAILTPTDDRAAAPQTPSRDDD